MSTRCGCIKFRTVGFVDRNEGKTTVRHSTALILTLVLLQSTGALAGILALNSGPRQVTLLELYTSQGCSSCPPAERWLHEYLEKEDLWSRIVPLAFHVDYCDYLGWKDEYARPENAERQRAYAWLGRTRGVYTPGLFVNGREWRGWMLRVNPRASDKVPGNLSVTVENNEVDATFEAETGPYELHVALMGFGIQTNVERGENRNSILRQDFVVLEHQSYPSSNNHWHVPLSRARPEADRYGIAVWVSTPGNPAPLQATGGWLPAGNQR